jgi:hypothetical protein
MIEPQIAPVCHCEERSDEAISNLVMGDCFASLAMTFLDNLRNLVRQ